ncbi:MAG: YjgP/YjgQ family permease [Calditrichaeota bacterium]|nr:MAG: YjgP/YjgQ family permease [Calditrichota bacterium]
MLLIDRYIIRKFLFILFYTSLAFIVIFIVVDLVEHLDEFLANKASFGDAVLYYIYYIPYIVILTLPINMLLSSLFSLGSMAQYNELIALMSSGVSLYRISAPLLVMALFISIISGVAGETLVPKTNRLRLDIWRYEIRKQKRIMTGTRREIALQDRGNREVNIQYYDGKHQKASRVNIVHVEGNQVVERWDAHYMIWVADSSGWKMNQVTYRVFTDTGEVVQRIPVMWYTDTHISPDDLLELQIKPEEMNYSELNRFVDKMLYLGADARKWLVDLYLKISYPLANFIIVLFGIPLASRKRRSGPALGFALALMISFVYFLFLRTGQVLGHNGTLEPWLGAWIGNIVFGIGGIFLMIKVRK